VWRLTAGILPVKLGLLTACENAYTVNTQFCVRKTQAARLCSPAPNKEEAQPAPAKAKGCVLSNPIITYIKPQSIRYHLLSKLIEILPHSTAHTTHKHVST
jgi:hypothetical protein